MKAAEQILKSSPNHGDTLAMKALIINSLGRRDEAFVLVKLALKTDISTGAKSHIPWHVYGLLYRADKNFEEAAKAYKFALRIEPESQQIQRDLALLQIQMRDYQGYVSSRRAMLQARSQLRQNWTALAIAHHLSGNLVDAEKVLSTYEETLKNPPPKSDLEHSEALLYKNSIIAELGETKRALEHLESVCKNSLDRLAFLELRANYLLKLNRKDEAQKAFRALIDRNPEQRAYYKGLESSFNDAERSADHLAAVYAEYAEKTPRGDAARRIPLEFLEGDSFKIAAENYLYRMLKKGVPSTFANLKSLYADPIKMGVIEKIVEDYALGHYPSHINGVLDSKINGDSSKLESSAYYFLAQHYNYHLSRNLTKAMEYIEKGLESSPQSVDFHMTKARIWKHIGDLQKASDTMEHARTLDEKDRYINSKAAKYQLRNDQNDTAINTMSKFTREGATGGALGDLLDMQCVWFLTEDGESFLRQGKRGLALKRFSAIYDIFEIWQEDQFDFHTFSLRKGHIRAYIDMVRWEDALREHPFFTRAAISAIKIYLLLHEFPYLAHESLANGETLDFQSLSIEDRKKAIKKAKRGQQKQEKVEAAKQEEQKPSKAGADGETKKGDQDPNGAKLVQIPEPLTDAMKYLTPLLEFSPKCLEVQLIGFEVFIRKRKYLLALKCLLAASNIDPTAPKVHEQIIQFATALEHADKLPPQVADIVSSKFTLISKDTSLAEFNDNYLEKHKSSAPRIHAVLNARGFINPSHTRSQYDEDMLNTLDLSGITMKEAQEGLGLLKLWKSKRVADYVSKAAAKWPQASAFRPRGGKA
ncbi:MAG: hypothetical protein M1829_004423 [Trizodia sp. TS-e1964]|nr:MAG: hypothetical protein M1829_004423 [Trizodia sp. TS-e1964]